MESDAKHKYLRLAGTSLTLGILIGLLLMPAGFAGTRTVDGNPSDWVGTPPAGVNTYTVDNGEWIWKDNTGDQRTDVTGHENCDLSEFRVTGDTENIYFLLRFPNMTDGWRVLVYIAVDTTLNSAGNDWFPDYTNTKVNANARWERVIKACTGTTGYYDTSWNYTTAGASYFSSANRAVEISMPWSALGVSLPATLRFTVMITAHHGDNSPENIPGTSSALDVITTVSGNTWGEVSDNVVDYYFDVSFKANGDAYYSTGLVAENSRPMYVTLSPAVGYVQIVSISDNINFGSLVYLGFLKEALTNPFTVVVKGENVAGINVYIKGTDLTGGGWTIGVDNIYHIPATGGSWRPLTSSYQLLRENLPANGTNQTIQENFGITVPPLSIPTTVNFTGTVWIRAQENTMPAP